MKTLFIISSMDPKQGGPCQGIRNTIPVLNDMGVTCEVVCLDNPSADFLNKDPFIIHAIGKGKTLWKYNNKLVPWLISNFNRFDSISIHGLWSYHSQATIKALFKYRENNKKSPRTYVMTHGMMDPYFQKAPDRRLKALRNDIYWKIFENKVINQADGVLFTCEEELLLARTTFPNYEPKKELNIGYGIQPPPENNPSMKNAFSSKVPDWNGKPFLLFLSRIHPKKGVDLLIKAYLQLDKERGSMPQLIIAGPNDNAYAKEMQVLASSSTKILFPDMLSGDSKWGAFYECEAFVLPSHQENFGIAVAEALASRCPVLISNKVNIWREIANGGAGIVEEDTLEGTYSLLKQFSNLTSHQIDIIKTNSYSVYQNNFRIEKTAKNFLLALNTK